MKYNLYKRYTIRQFNNHRGGHGLFPLECDFLLLVSPHICFNTETRRRHKVTTLSV